MKALIAALLFSNCWVAICFSVLIAGVCFEFHSSIRISYTLFAFFGTISAYTLHRLARLKQVSHTVQQTVPRLIWMKRNSRIVQIIFITSILGSTICLCLLPWNLASICVLIGVGVIIVFYALPSPFIPSGLRSIPGLKIGLITASWVVLSMIPFLINKQPIPFDTTLTIALLTFAQIIPFDLRDLDYDHPGMYTIPQILGVLNSRILASILALTTIIVLYQYHGFHWLHLILLSVSLIGFYIRTNEGNEILLELLWETPLLLLGLSFMLG